MKAPFLSKNFISLSAEAVLLRYIDRKGGALRSPIPVEDIIERSLDLELSFVDFEGQHGLSDVLGATYVDKGLICINEGLLNTGAEGRYFFTCAHEIGHWILHRQLVREPRCRSMPDMRILCRTKDAKSSIEWQADYFASCLLMPNQLLERTFRSLFGDRPLELINVESACSGPICFDPCVENWPQIADAVRRTGGFSNVSKQAMIIRLQDLGLVVNATNRPLAWTHRPYR